MRLEDDHALWAAVVPDGEGYAVCANPSAAGPALLRFLDLDAETGLRVPFADYSRAIEEHTAIPEPGTPALRAIWEGEERIMITWG